MENKTTKPFYNTTIPSDWEVKKLIEITKKIGDGLHGTPEYVNDSIYFFINGNNIKDGSVIINNDTKCVSEKEYVKHRKDLKYKALLLSINGTIGSIAFYRNERIVLGKSAAYINCNDENVDFLYHYLQSSQVLNFYEEELTGSTIRNLSLKTIRDTPIKLPPLPEQRAIAHVLSLMDSAINQNNQLIAQKELCKKWLMQNLLTGKKRLKGFDREWKKLGAGEVFKSITVKGFEDEELLSATQDRGIIPRTMLDGRVTMPDGTTAGYKLVEPGDFVISLRSFQGGLEYSYYRGIVSPAYIVLKPRKKINDEFYKQYYKSYEFIGRLATAVIGIRDGKQISYDDYCIVKIPYPSYEEQTAISQVLQAADKEIQLLKAKTDKLREQKKGMMQQLLTGKKRLKI